MGNVLEPARCLHLRFFSGCLFSNLPQQVSDHSFISESGGMEEQVRAMELTDACFKLWRVCVAVNTPAFLREWLRCGRSVLMKRLRLHMSSAAGDKPQLGGHKKL